MPRTKAEIESVTRAAFLRDLAELRKVAAATHRSGYAEIRTSHDEYVCSACSAEEGKVYSLDDLPELPHKNCSSETGCRCSIAMTTGPLQNQQRKFQPLTDLTMRAISGAATAAKESIAPSGKTIEERRSVLQREITSYVRQGYRVVSQTDTTAQLVKPKNFSLLWALLWFFLFGIGLVVYLVYYWSKRDLAVYLEVDEQGRVKKR